MDTHPKKISPLTVDFRPPNYLESLISPIVESIETFLNAEEEGGGRRGNGKQAAADRRPLSGRARLGIREEGKEGEGAGKQARWPRC